MTTLDQWKVINKSFNKEKDKTEKVAKNILDGESTPN